MTIASDVQQLEPGGLIELFEVDCTQIGGDVLRFHQHLQSGPITWQGNVYTPWPVKTDGFELNGQASQSSPTLTVANVDGSITVLCAMLDDLVGAVVRRHRTLAQYLDGQPDADPTAEMPVQLWFVEQKTNEDNVSVQFALSSALDFSGQQLPAGQVLATLCPPQQFPYRGTGCGYTGTAYFDANDNPVSDPSQDACSRRLSGCQCRFGKNNPLPFGGYPSAGTAGTLG